MALRNAFGAIALDSTVAAARDLLTTIRDAVGGVLTAKPQTSLITGTISALNGVIDGVTDLSGYASVKIQFAGTFVATVTFEASTDGVTWTAITLNYSGGGNGSSGTGSTTAYGNLTGRYFRLRATSYTSGTVNANVLYSSQATATIGYNSVILGSGSSYVGKVRPDQLVMTTANLSALNAVADGTTDASNFGSVRLQVSGTWIGTLGFQTSLDGTNWYTRYLQPTSSNIPVLSTSNGNNGVYFGDIAGRYFRVIATAYTSGTAVVSILYSAATSGHDGMQASLRASAQFDANGSASTDLVSLGAYNGSTIDRLVTGPGVATSKSLSVLGGSNVGISPNAATAPVAGTALDNYGVRSSHTMQVDVVTTTVSTAGNHAVRLEGSLDNTNWYPLGSVALQANSLTAADPSNHAILFVSDSPIRYLRANWTTIPTGWTGTLSARVASA